MKIVEFYSEKQGRPKGVESPRIPSGSISGVLLQASYSTVELTNNYTASGRTMILVDTGSGDVVVTLPAASSNAGKYYIIKKVDSSGHTVKIESSGNELIDGEQSISLGLQYQYVVVCSSGVKVGDSHWHIIGGEYVKMEEVLDRLLNEEIDLLYQLLIEVRQSKLHLASISNEPIESGDGEDDG